MGQSLSTTLDLPDSLATAALGRRLAERLPAETRGWTILLQGELGSGKSTLARAMLRALGFEGSVPSPTYTLVEPYVVAGRIIYHVDLYRLSDDSELPYLGWTDLDDGLKLIEWPERAPSLETSADICIRLRFSGVGRSADLLPLSRRGTALLAGW